MMKKNSQSQTPTFPMQLRGFLLLAGMYGFAWSAFFRYFDADLFRWLSMDAGWSVSMGGRMFGSVGMMTSFCIFLSAFYPIRWRYLTWIGIGGIVLSTLWFSLMFVPELGWNKRTLFHLIFNELIWLALLVMVSRRAYQVKKYIDNDMKNPIK